MYRDFNIQLVINSLHKTGGVAVCILQQYDPSINLFTLMFTLTAVLFIAMGRPLVI